MTFDDYNKELITIVDTYGEKLYYSDINKLVEKLRKEYAPTIEMTSLEKEQLLTAKSFKSSFSQFWDEIKSQPTKIKLGLQSGPITFATITESELMSAWLHPESIKINPDTNETSH